MFSLEEALSSIEGAQSPDEMQAVFHTLIGKLGYCAFSYFDVRRVSASDGALPWFQTTSPDRFVTEYMGEGFLDYDPVVARAAWSNVPFDWSEFPEFQELDQPRRGVKSRARKIMAFARDHGMNQGIAIPVHAVDSAGRPASSFFSLYWAEPLAGFYSPAARPAALRLVALSYHERMLELRGLQGKELELPTLTDRERECLLWAFRGKTMAETATILGCGSRTAEFHMKNAMQKLGVHNKFHAVAVAIQLGLIAP
ncbi:MAG TPA: LuxR family transcriptional regulator [Azospirillaceae bacterium]|nr:LuxR family transcriptional regulator [Azospirillaceae bacterium]